MIAVVRGTGNTHDAERAERLAGMKASVVSWLITAALSLSLVLVALGGLTATAAAVAGSLGLAHGACQRTEATLATDLGISINTLRATDPAELANQIAARQTAGALTPTDALHATDRATSYVTCHQVFGKTTTSQPGDR